MLEEVKKYTKSLIALRASKLLITALAINLASATLMHAQQLDIEGEPPYGVPTVGVVGWNESATMCTVLPGSAAIAVMYGNPHVDFRPHIVWPDQFDLPCSRDNERS